MVREYLKTYNNQWFKEMESSGELADYVQEHAAEILESIRDYAKRLVKDGNYETIQAATPSAQAIMLPEWFPTPQSGTSFEEEEKEADLRE